MPTRVFKYGLRPPFAGLDAINDQLRRGHGYYNRLVEWERDREDKRDAIFLDCASASYLDVEAERCCLDDLLQELRVTAGKERAKNKSRTFSDGLREQIAVVKAQEREVYKFWRAERLKVWKDKKYRERIKRLDEEKRKEYKAISADRKSPYWGTKAIKAQSIEQAREKIEDEQARTGDNKLRPKFKPWKGRGSLAVQFQGGLTMDEALSCQDTRMQLVPLSYSDKRFFRQGPLGPNPNSKRSQRRKHYILNLRVTSEGTKNTPVFGQWHLIMHRPIPDGGKIMWAKVLREKLADKEQWSLHLSVRLGDYVADPKAEPSEAVLAVDLGWRMLDGRDLRVGYLYDGQKQTDVHLEESIMSGLRKEDELKSIRDKNLEDIKEELSAWYKTHKVLCPAEISERLRGIKKLESKAKLASIFLLWRDNRFSGDDDIFDALERWEAQDRHLWKWQDNQRDKVLSRRKHAYRNIAATLARKYGVLVLENFNLSDRVVRRPKIEEDDGDLALARSNRQKAAPYEFRLALIQAFEARKRVIVWLPAYNTTKICHACGSIEKWNQAEELTHKCSSCGKLWDQDNNAAKNLFQDFHAWKYKSEWSSGDIIARKNDKPKVSDFRGSRGAFEGRWQRRKREKRERSDLDAYRCRKGDSGVHGPGVGQG